MVKMQLSQLEMSQIMHLEKDSVKKRLKRIRMEKMKADSGVTLEELFAPVLAVEAGHARALRMYEPDVRA